jgi:hypothetical protein
VYGASFRSDGKLICMGFENNNVKVFPLFDETQSKEYLEVEDGSEQPGTTSGKPKKRPLRKFDDHLGYEFFCFKFPKILTSKNQTSCVLQLALSAGTSHLTLLDAYFVIYETITGRNCHVSYVFWVPQK